MTETDTTNQAKYRRALTALEKKHGTLTPDIVVSAARPPKSELHDWFEWDKDKNAHSYLLIQARNLIRYVTISVTERVNTISVPFFVRDPEIPADKQGYVSLTSTEIDRRAAAAIVSAELKRCTSSVERARGVTDVLDEKFPGLSDELDLALAQLLKVKARFDATERSEGAGEHTAPPAH